MRVLVTGAAGFIGSHVSERLCARGGEVVGFDNFDPFYERALKEANLRWLRSSPGFHLVEGDVRDAAALARTFATAKPEVVVHLAALAGVRPSVAEPARYADVNVTGTQRLIDAAVAHGVRRFVFASSSSVYGADSEPPFKETDACLRPLSPYAATKRAAELLLFTAHHLYALDVVALRFFTVFGPRQRPDLAINKFVRLIAAEQPVEIYGDGSSSRDYTFIDDIVDGVLAAIDQPRAAQPGYRIYNLGGAHATTVAELVAVVARVLGKTPRFAWRLPQPGDMGHTLADLTRASGALGYAPRTSIEEGVRRFVEWLSDPGRPTAPSSRSPAARG
jgi:UDP-glucuronate 4-epimerase